MGMVVMSKCELIRLIGSDAYEGVQLKKLKEVTKIVFWQKYKPVDGSTTSHDGLYSSKARQYRPSCNCAHIRFSIQCSRAI
jgi:hypothetical protein